MKQNNLAPILLFVYKRPVHTQKTLESLANNPLAKDSILYIYADAPKTGADAETIEGVRKTREVIKQKQWCKEVHIVEYEENQGIAPSMIRNVTETVDKYGKVIVLEDDIITAPCFLQYMNEALFLYENNKEVLHISGYAPVTTGADKLPDTYFLRNMGGWGWATWQDAWTKFNADLNFLHSELPKRKDFSKYDFDGASAHFDMLKKTRMGELVDVWDIQWYSSIFLNEGLCLLPKYSVTKNIGMDGSGDHCAVSPEYDVNLAEEIKVYPIEIKESARGYDYWKRFYRYGNDSSFCKRVLLNIKSILKKIYFKLK